MKKSQFNVLHKINEDETIIYNSYSGALAKIDREYIDALNNISDINSIKNDDIIRNMKKCGFVVEKEIDELGKVKELSELYKNISKKLKLVIAPTLECNFKCSYCYETPEVGSMEVEIQEDILAFCKYMIKKNGIQEISVFWYGGEPLLYKEIINNISTKIINLCNQNNVKYIAGIVTNGYLIDENTANQFIENKIVSAQITLDGTKEVHDVRRNLISGIEGTFDKILKNINILIGKKINVTIRMNVDNENKENISKLVEKLKEKILDKKRLNFNLGCVFPNEEDKNDRNKYCMNNKEFAEVKLNALCIAQEYGLEKSVDRAYPKKRFNYCSAPTELSYVIHPKGKVYKCWNDICEDNLKIGYIKDLYNLHLNSINNDISEKWRKHTVLENNKCIKCNILPLCAGGCPRNQVHNGEMPKCEDLKYNIGSIIELYYNRSKDRNKKR